MTTNSIGASFNRVPLSTIHEEIDIKDELGLTALMHACMRGHVEVVRDLLLAGADANWQDSEHWTPLMWACRCGHKEIVELLLEFHADKGFSLQNNHGRTALIMASAQGYHEIVDLLIKYNSRV